MYCFDMTGWHPAAVVLFFALIVWGIVWKAIALWTAAKNNQKPWYVILLFVNTLGLLEIIYLKFFQRKNAAVKTAPGKKAKRRR
jgi:hypothetical protein